MEDQIALDPKLRESPFDLEAFSDSDYGGSNLDRKSTTGGCQFLGQRLISWQCKKQTIVATSTTEAEYVAAANCCGQDKKHVAQGSIPNHPHHHPTNTSSPQFPTPTPPPIPTHQLRHLCNTTPPPIPTPNTLLSTNLSTPPIPTPTPPPFQHKTTHLSQHLHHHPRHHLRTEPSTDDYQVISRIDKPGEGSQTNTKQNLGKCNSEASQEGEEVGRVSKKEEFGFGQIQEDEGT
ncbi:uncharacterized mitochondrial protein-like protein [Tanacetum coccineum]|uniref:Uncharacterized mitochondrial protein-like protein n=1 Tax=Tanacetum coccineum TaxID=301880 RepID=A0ABQ4Z191_9ASTR